jgi:hypothetical protein
MLQIEVITVIGGMDILWKLTANPSLQAGGIKQPKARL